MTELKDRARKLGLKTVVANWQQYEKQDWLKSLLLAEEQERDRCKLHEEVKVIRTAKDDGIRLENEDNDMRVLEFDVKEHRLMCLEAMKNLVRAGYFHLDSIAITCDEQPNGSKLTIKTYKITDEGRIAPLLAPMQSTPTKT